MFDQASLDRLQRQIEEKKHELEAVKKAYTLLHRELEAFAEQYDKLVGPLETELDRVRQQIERLVFPGGFDFSFNDVTGGGLWGEYGSFEESFDAKYRRRAEDPTRASTWNPKDTANMPVDENELRTLYRKLARKYHPDTTTDENEKLRLTMLMAQINAAYRAKNLKELRAIDGNIGSAAGKYSFGGASGGKVPMPDISTLAKTVTFADLINQVRVLSDEIDTYRIAHHNMMMSPLMNLKIEAGLARGKGRNLISEIAAKVRADLVSARTELASLKR